MSKYFRITLWVLMVASTPMLFLSFSSFALIDLAASAVGLLFSALYLVIVMWLLSITPLWPDFKSYRRLPDGTKRKGQGSTFLWVFSSLWWGACVAVGIVMLMGLSVFDLMDKLNWDFVSMSFAGAYPEEIAKALGVAIILLRFRQLNRPWHGFVTGALVGLGFEVNENILYGATGAMFDPNSDMAGVLVMWQYRTLAGPLIHTLLTGFAGYGIALAFFTARKSVAWRIGVAAVGLGIAFVLHFSWNLLWESYTAQIINIVVISLIMYPLAAFIIWRSWKESRDDQTYAYAPGAITTARELALIAPPAVVSEVLTAPEQDQVEQDPPRYSS
ncbi:PrsW family intramembrane metalloprotease [Corynebacterium callunae]|uniref:PrsW family intramembrane metalloprotease n=1 Tax=Corynebacterium callunae TaxID=1721 RepID=UPI003982290A